MAYGGKREGAGRPAGVRNKVTKDVKDLAQEFGEEAIKALVEIVRDGEAPHAARVAAIREVLDRGYGKAKQGLEVTGAEGGPVSMVTRIELVDLVDDREDSPTA
jgi:hypothetical protein